MRKYAFMSIFVVGHRRIILTGVLPINNKTIVVQTMAWGQIGNRPLFEPMITLFTDAYISLGLNELTSGQQPNTSRLERNGNFAENMNFLEWNNFFFIPISLKYVPEGLTDNKWPLVEIMFWCHEVTSHYLNRCWPRSMMTFGLSMPQWVNKYVCLWPLLIEAEWRTYTSVN